MASLRAALEKERSTVESLKAEIARLEKCLQKADSEKNRMARDLALAEQRFAEATDALARFKKTCHCEAPRACPPSHEANLKS